MAAVFIDEELVGGVSGNEDLGVIRIVGGVGADEAEPNGGGSGEV